MLLPVAALGALLARGHARLEVLHVLAGGGQGLLEGAVEVRHGLLEGELAVLDAVEVALHARGVLGIHQVVEALDQQVGDHHAQLRGLEAALVLLHVVPVLDGADDAGVGGGPADAVLFQLLHQRGFVEAGGGLGELLVRVELLQLQGLAQLQGRQQGLVLVLFLGALGGIGDGFGIGLGLFGAVDRQPAGEALDLALGLEQGRVLAEPRLPSAPPSRRSGRPPSGKPWSRRQIRA